MATCQGSWHYPSILYASVGNSLCGLLRLWGDLETHNVHYWFGISKLFSSNPLIPKELRLQKRNWKNPGWMLAKGRSQQSQHPQLQKQHRHPSQRRQLRLSLWLQQLQRRHPLPKWVGNPARSRRPQSKMGSGAPKFLKVHQRLFNPRRHQCPSVRGVSSQTQTLTLRSTLWSRPGIIDFVCKWFSEILCQVFCCFFNILNIWTWKLPIHVGKCQDASSAWPDGKRNGKG